MQPVDVRRRLRPEPSNPELLLIMPLCAAWDNAPPLRR
jgi:hypothetical protein